MSDTLYHTASILVVDDNVWMQRILSKMLLSFSVTPRFASNAYEAIGIAVNELPNAIILDVVMPEINGIQTLRLLKSINVTQSIPVLVITAAGDSESMSLALRLGADGFIRKPFTRASLLEKLRSVLHSTVLLRVDGPIPADDFSVEDSSMRNSPEFTAPPRPAARDVSFGKPQAPRAFSPRMKEAALLRHYDVSRPTTRRPDRPDGSAASGFPDKLL